MLCGPPPEAVAACQKGAGAKVQLTLDSEYVERSLPAQKAAAFRRQWSHQEKRFKPNFEQAVLLLPDHTAIELALLRPHGNVANGSDAERARVLRPWLPCEGNDVKFARELVRSWLQVPRNRSQVQALSTDVPCWSVHEN